MMTTQELIKRMTGLKFEMMQVAYDMTFSTDQSIHEHSTELLGAAKILNDWIEHLINKEIA